MRHTKESKTPTDWNSPTSPRSTGEVLSQVRSHLHRNSEYTRGDSPEPEDLEAYRNLDPSCCGSPTNEDDIVTAGELEGQAPIHRRKYREESCVCTGVEGPNGVFTNTRSRSNSRAPEAAHNSSEMKKATRDTRMRSRSSSRAPEARNGSDSSKAKSKKAKDTE